MLLLVEVFFAQQRKHQKLGSDTGVLRRSFWLQDCVQRVFWGRQIEGKGGFRWK